MRYRSRFTSGMTIDIQPPDYEMSMAILRNKQENSDIQLNEEILDYIQRLDIEVYYSSKMLGSNDEIISLKHAKLRK